MSFHLQVQCATTFDEVIERGVQIDQSLIAKGLIKAFSKDHPAPIHPKNSMYFNKNKNMVSDGITDAKHIQAV